MNPFTPIYLVAAFGGLVLALVFTPLVRTLAFRHGIVDRPETAGRKIHHRPVPLLGGWAIFAAVMLVIFALRLGNLADFSRVPDQFLAAIFFGGLLIMIGGSLDDKYRLKPWQQTIWPLAAAALVLAAGIKISYLTNPFSGANGIWYLAPAVGAALSFVWLMGMMYTTKLLDGLDGLVAGITAIAALMIFFLSLDWDVPLSATGSWALALLGAALGFLVFNWHPAKIFLGEGGSIFMGFMLGVLSIISGSKIATTLLVVGLPALDVFWVIIRRLAARQSPFSHADRKHLHFQLLAVGLGQRQAVLFLYLIALAFGLAAVLTTSWGKLLSLLALVLVMVLIIAGIYLKSAANDAKK